MDFRRAGSRLISTRLNSVPRVSEIAQQLATDIEALHALVAIDGNRRDGIVAANSQPLRRHP